MVFDKQQYMRDYFKKRRAEARRDGDCIVCCARPALPGKIRCVRCVNYIDKGRAKRRARLKEAGVGIMKCSVCRQEEVCRKCHKDHRDGQAQSEPDSGPR